MVAACPFSCCGAVALRKESVDRNLEAVAMVRWTLVALRKESVDRNPQPHIFLCNLLVSLSARRAWIEISTQCRL